MIQRKGSESIERLPPVLCQRIREGARGAYWDIIRQQNKKNTRIDNTAEPKSALNGSR
jgi:hypothetical protein